MGLMSMMVDGALVQICPSFVSKEMNKLLAYLADFYNCFPPRIEFQQAVKETKAGRETRGFTCEHNGCPLQ
jgi:hypothetical protein